MLEAIRDARPDEAAIIAWRVVCGRAVAQQAKALEFVDGVLRVEVPDKSWRTELLAFVPQYLAALNQVAKVDRIEFVVRGEKKSAEAKK